jgi:hypothetical protein
MSQTTTFVSLKTFAPDPRLARLSTGVATTICAAPRGKPLLDEFLSNHRTSDVAALLDHWQAGNTMRRAGSSQRVVVTMQGLRVEAR